MSKYFEDFTTVVDILPEGKRKMLDSVADFPPEATWLALSGKRGEETAGWELLPGRTAVDTVFLYDPKEKHLEALAHMPRLTRLGIRNLKITDLSALSALKKLDFFFIEDALNITSLEFLRPLQSLKAFGVFDAKRLNDLSGLEGLTKLEELRLSSGIWNVLKVKTLKPLAGLKKLTYLDIRLEAADDSLEPVRHLKSLKELGLNLLFPLEEYAKLAAFLPEKISSLLREPYFEHRELCRKDKSHVSILTAKGHRRFCRDCQPQKLADYLAEFTKVRDETRRKKRW